VEPTLPGVEGPAVVEREALFMGTVLSVRVVGRDRGAALAASESAFAAVRRVDGLVNTWRQDTELATVNRAPIGKPVVLSTRLLDVLKRVAELRRATGGAFDPAVGALLDAWDLRGQGRVPGPAELQAALSWTGLDRVVLDPVRGTMTRRAPGWLDAGGFGKGAALDAALASLRRAGVARAVLDFGGQVALLGYGGTSGVVVRVASPVSRSTPVVGLRLGRGSAATTSASERRRRVGGEVVGHVLDPRTGRPVPPWGSVTVVAADALTADVLSTALFVMGPEEALDWARGHGVAVLVLESAPQGVTGRWSAGMRDRLTCVVGSVAVETPLPLCGAPHERWEEERAIPAAAHGPP
jgi:thiamine biosynthesis lipoprotein